MGFKVLVTGASEPAGRSMIHALQAEPVTVLSCDVAGEGPGAGGVPPQHCFTIHGSDDPEFVGDLVALCVRHGVDVLVPTRESEQLTLARQKDVFERFGAHVWLAPIPVHATRSQVRRIVLLGQRGRGKAAMHSWWQRLSGGGSSGSQPSS